MEPHEEWNKYEEPRHLIINGVSGVWSNKDIEELMEIMGHDRVCRASSYLGVWQRCYRSFRQLKLNGHFVTRSSQYVVYNKTQNSCAKRLNTTAIIENEYSFYFSERSDIAGVLDRWSSSPLLPLTFWGATLASLGYCVTRFAIK